MNTHDAARSETSAATPTVVRERRKQLFKSSLTLKDQAKSGITDGSPRIHSPHEGRVHVHKSRSPIARHQSSIRQIYSRISVCGWGERNNTHLYPHDSTLPTLTFSLSASGAVHLTGNLVPSVLKSTSRVSPKSDTLATLSSAMRTFRAAKSLSRGHNRGKETNQVSQLHVYTGEIYV